MSEGGDKAHSEFLSEAQELIEALSRSLLALEQGRAAGQPDPEQLNESFRSVHTLKSLAGLFGDKQMSQLSHRLEDLLDDLRLGRQELSDIVLDLLFTSVDVYWQLLKQPDGAPVRGVEEILDRIDKLAPGTGAATGGLEGFEIDSSLLAVLTEYEEHRLLVNAQQGLNLYLLRVHFELATLDKALADIKDKAKPFGEVITYLPAGEAASPELIELDLLLASNADEHQLEETLGTERVSVRQIPRRASSSGAVHGPTSRSSTGSHARSSTKSVATTALNTRVPRTGDSSDSLSGPEGAGGLLRSISQTVRVDIHKLDELMNLIGKLAVLRGGLSELTEDARSEGSGRLGSQLSQLSHRFERSLRDLQSGLLEVRMVPLAQVFERLTRVVRQTSKDLGKEVRLVVTGAETEIDKLIVEELSDPLMHIIRNAIDHGVEDAEERERVGKPRAGTIALNAFQKGNHVVIEAEDDGRGLNSDWLLDRAVQLGAVGQHEAKDLSREEALNLVFLPGLSTRGQASAVSGRGVGMDVVKTNIAKLGGSIELESEPIIGTKITLTLPLTRAIVTALLVQVADGMFAIPLTSISEVNALQEGNIRTLDATEVLSRRGASLELCRLRKLFEFQESPPARQFVVEVMAGPRRLGLVVDGLHGQQDIIIRPLGRSLNAVRGFSGASELADERIALVLDPGSLIEEAASATHRERGPGAQPHA